MCTKYTKLIFIGTVVFLLFSCITKAQKRRNYIAFSAAVFDVLQQNNTAFEGRIEFRLNKTDWVLKPFGGTMANTDGAIHIYAGLFYELEVTSFLFITPSFAPGIYFSSKSKNLDFALQFRSQIELGINLQNDIKVGISFNHISNASLGNTNPGVESIAISYYFPL